MIDPQPGTARYRQSGKNAFICVAKHHSPIQCWYNCEINAHPHKLCHRHYYFNGEISYWLQYSITGSNLFNFIEMCMLKDTRLTVRLKFIIRFLIAMEAVACCILQNNITNSSVTRLTISFGAGNSILRSIRPGRSSAESRMSIRLVAMITCNQWKRTLNGRNRSVRRVETAWHSCHRDNELSSSACMLNIPNGFLFWITYIKVQSVLVITQSWGYTASSHVVTEVLYILCVATRGTCNQWACCVKKAVGKHLFAFLFSILRVVGGTLRFLCLSMTRL